VLIPFSTFRVCIRSGIQTIEQYFFRDGSFSVMCVIRFLIFIEWLLSLIFNDYIIFRPMLGGSLVTTAWRALQVWMVAANILNKQSRTADNGWSSSFGVGRGANKSSP
jgi:hypothetical protein